MYRITHNICQESSYTLRIYVYMHVCCSTVVGNKSVVIMKAFVRYKLFTNCIVVCMKQQCVHVTDVCSLSRHVTAVIK